MTTASGFQQNLPEEIIRRAQTGDMLACEKIYRTYSKACFNLALRICSNKAMSQDIVQDVFIKVISRISSYKHQGSFAGWLRRIVAHETVNRIKSENRVHLVSVDETFDIESNNLFNQEWLISCKDLESLLNKLPTTSRAVLWLHEVEGFNHKEIATLYNKSESFSKVTLSRAYTSLKANVLRQEKRNALK